MLSLRTRLVMRVMVMLMIRLLVVMAGLALCLLMLVLLGRLRCIELTIGDLLSGCIGMDWRNLMVNHVYLCAIERTRLIRSTCRSTRDES